MRAGLRRALLPAHPAPRAVEVEVTDAGLLLARASEDSQDGSTTLACSNSTSVPLTLLFERADFPSDAVPGTLLATFPEFIDLFSAEAPAVGWT